MPKSNESATANYVHVPITNFFANDPNAEPDDLNVHVNLNTESLNYIADKISERMIRTQSRCSDNPASKSNANDVDRDQNRPSSSCSNLTDFLELESQFELISEGEVHLIRCSTCYAYVSDPDRKSVV